MEARFLLSAASPAQFPPDPFPEVAFAGRSNVGKSSMINRLLERRNLVKTGNTPGKTRLVNFFLVREKIVFTDLPGYGYAAVSKAERAAWGKLIDAYFQRRQQLRLCVLLQDIRRIPSEDDKRMLDAMSFRGVPVLKVLTKADKLSGNQIAKQTKIICETLNCGKNEQVLFSSVTGRGKDEVWERINAAAGIE